MTVKLEFQKRYLKEVMLIFNLYLYFYYFRFLKVIENGHGLGKLETY
jgi:hypothetical protein